MAGFISCEDTTLESDPEGILSIGIAVDSEDPSTKSALNDSSISSNIFIALLSIINEDGEMVFQDKKIELYRFNNQFVSEEIKMKTGEYDLVRFLVLDPLGNVIFAAPMEGSPLAYLVLDPLPVHFKVTKNQHTFLAPEVLPVWNHTPEDFGYLSFGVSIVRPLVFFAAAYMYYENPMIMAPSLITSADMVIMADSTWKHRFKLEPRINRIIVRDGYPYYYIKVKKEGFVPFVGRFHRNELKRHTQQNPLMFPLKYQMNDTTIVIPPDTSIVEPPDTTIVIPGDTTNTGNG
jgi:hypothetical protein